MRRLRVYLGNYWLFGLLATFGVTFFATSSIIKGISLVVGILIGLATLITKFIEGYKGWQEVQIRSELKTFLREESDVLDEYTVQGIKEILRDND